jgi:inner membrane protein
MLICIYQFAAENVASQRVFDVKNVSISVFIDIKLTAKEDRHMLGKTHFVVGITAGLALLAPGSLQELIVGTGAATIGSVISDIDVDTSESHEKADTIIAVALVAATAVVAVEEIWHIGLFDHLMQNSSALRITTGIAGFLILCAYGKEQPHRSFMHSIAALGLLTGCVYIFFPVAAPYFAIAFLTHLILDLTNKKKMKLFWPSKQGLSLGLFTAQGWINQVLFGVGSLTAVGMFIYMLVQCVL